MLYNRVFYLKERCNKIMKSIKVNGVNLALIVSVLIAILLIVSIISNVIKSNDSNEVSNSVIDNTSVTTTVEQSSEDTQDTTLDTTITTDVTSLDVSTNDDVISISDEHNNIYIENSNGANVVINGSEVVTQSTKEYVSSDDNQEKNIGNANINIQVN